MTQKIISKKERSLDKLNMAVRRSEHNKILITMVITSLKNEKKIEKESYEFLHGFLRSLHKSMESMKLHVLHLDKSLFHSSYDSFDFYYSSISIYFSSLLKMERINESTYKHILELMDNINYSKKYMIETEFYSLLQNNITILKHSKGNCSIGMNKGNNSEEDNPLNVAWVDPTEENNDKKL